MGIDKNQRGAKKGSDRDSGGFIALLWSVIDSKAYKSLSYPAKALLIEFSRQYCRDNNGRLLASLRYLKTRGWTSNDVITRAKKELLDGGFIFQTVQGHRPNKASWYAITWQGLDKLKGYDSGVMERWKECRSGYAKTNPKIGVINPAHGPKVHAIRPPSGVMRPCTNPSSGSMRSDFPSPAIPPNGDHLEIPSAVVLSQTFGNQCSANSSIFLLQCRTSC